MNNIQLPGSAGRPILTDAIFKTTSKPKPVVIFSHGFKGFKDWGAFNLIAQKFAEAGFVFIKFNYSHNGTTPMNPMEFTDLEAFGNNNYTIELDDLGIVIDKMLSGEILSLSEINPKEIYLMGHSRGGGLSILKANEDNRIKKLVTWAAVNNMSWGWTPEVLETWKQTGIRYTENKRTGQKMPLYYQLAENYLQNAERLNIEKAVENLTIPFMAIHGTEDEVPMKMAITMKQWNPAVRLEILPGADHVFGARHPYNFEKMPTDLQIAINYSIEFFKNRKV